MNNEQSTFAVELIAALVLAAAALAFMVFYENGLIRWLFGPVAVIAIWIGTRWIKARQRDTKRTGELQEHRDKVAGINRIWGRTGAAQKRK